MNIAQVSSQPVKSKTNWMSLFQLVLSVLAACLLFSSAAIIVISAIVRSLTEGTAAPDPTMSFMVAGSLAFAGVLTLPSAWYAWKRITHPEFEPAPWKEPRYFATILTVLVVVLVGGALVIGDWISTNSSISWLLLPPLNIIATGLPALWVIYIGTRGLIAGRRSRWWGIFSTGLVYTPIIILVVELFVLIGVGILAIIWVAFDTTLSDQLFKLATLVQETGADPEALVEVGLPFLLNPGIMFLAFAFISLIVPIIEEALKPLGVWFLSRQRLTPAQGFGFGVLCGAGFGLFENLGNTSGGGETWAILTATRASTLLLHCLNSGLVGWGLASAWNQKRYLRLGVTFLYAVLIHGLWNGLAVLSLFGQLRGEFGLSIPDSLEQLGELAPIGIVAIAAFNLIFYISFNSTLRKTRSTPPRTAITGTLPSLENSTPVSSEAEISSTPESNS